MCLVLVPFGLWVLWTAYRPVAVENVSVDEILPAVESDNDAATGVESTDADADTSDELTDEADTESPHPS
jgi:hypothetical protein